MHWQAVDTIAIDMQRSMAPARADAIRAALLRRAIPILAFKDGRAEPLATASLVRHDGQFALLTAAHALDEIGIGDLALPLPLEGRIVSLRDAQLRVLTHAHADLAMILLPHALAARVASSWKPLSWTLLDRPPTAAVFVIAGYPVEQMRRNQGVLYSKPLVLFTTWTDLQFFAYARTAYRTDGVCIHTPALEGVSGAAIWQVVDEEDDGISCRLQPTAIQVAFRHGQYLRGEMLEAVAPLMSASVRC